MMVKLHLKQLILIPARPRQLWDPAIPDWRTLSKFRENGDQGKVIKHGDWRCSPVLGLRCSPVPQQI